jgi:hypothetical protein
MKTDYREGDIVRYTQNPKEYNLAIIVSIISSIKGERVFKLSDGNTIHEKQITLHFIGILPN